VTVVEQFRSLRPGQRCRVRIAHIDTGTSTTVYETDELLLEAPNWTLDGSRLILNGAGRLWRFDLETERLDPIALEDVPVLNNDHVLDPDGDHIYVSANDGHIYRAPLTGGTARRVTRDTGMWHFLHGVSPDGASLAFVGVELDDDYRPVRADIGIVGTDGGDSTMLTESRHPDDGPEYSPDGEWLYLNTERFSRTPGHAQIARMRPDGSAVEQLTFDGNVNWFPHLSPRGDAAVYLSYPPGTQGHPADLDVSLRLVRDGAWRAATTVVDLFGGQGTINVNSWTPTGERFAFVDYPIAASAP
jgi:Tol biopolymer transport system component